LPRIVTRTSSALLALAFAAARLAHAQCPDGTPPPCGRRVVVAAPVANSVAVLYFENLGRDTSDAYIADGLTEEVTARLGQVRRLTVTSRATVRRLRNAAETPTADLGRALSVMYLVNGSVRRAGDRLRVTVELVRASSGVRVWGDQFDRGTGDLLALQEDIARNVATGIAGQLLPAERRALAARPTRSPEAYDHYLRAAALLRVISPTSLAQTIEQVDAALRLDPGYADALGVQSVAYTLALNWNFATPRLTADSLLAHAIASSDAALRADSNSPTGWLARGALACYRYPRDCAGRMDAAFQRSLALDSSSAQAHYWYATWLRRLGRFEAGEAEEHRALALDPRAVLAAADIGFIHYQHRRFAEAVRWVDSAERLDATSLQYFYIGTRARLSVGDTAGARREADSAVAFATAAGNARLMREIRVQVLAAGGDTARARAELDDLLPGVAGADSVSIRDGVELSLSLIAVGRRDEGLAMLERTRPRGAWLWSYLWFPGFDVVRQDPRFRRVYQQCKPADAADPPGM
jgi:TolB-like protein/tetratricopeptide (TPR) repeat protein